MDTSPVSPPAPYLADLLALAQQAFAHTAQAPEVRARDTVAAHSTELQADLALIRQVSPSTTDFHAQLYEHHYRRYFSEWLQAHAQLAPLNQSSRQIAKATNREQARLLAFTQWRSRALAKIQHEVSGPRTPETELERVGQQLAGREQAQRRMKTLNSAIRTKTPIANLRAQGLTEAEAVHLINKQGYSDAELGNNNAQIRRLKRRQQELQDKARLQPLGSRVVASFAGTQFDAQARGELVANYALNRVQIHFTDKPSDDLRTALRGRGFIWAPSHASWQRQLTDGALSIAGVLLGITAQVSEFLATPVVAPLLRVIPGRILYCSSTFSESC